MDLELGEAYEKFRNEVQGFLTDHWPLETSTGDAERDAQTFRKSAAAAGFLYRGFPTEYGGGGTERPVDSFMKQILREEFTKVGAPYEIQSIGVAMFAPTLLHWGSESQKRRFLPGTLSGEIKWCQGYSEPGAGSDLASLRTRGEIVGKDWVISGQKIWTSGAHEADYMFILVRTDPDAPKHSGISYLLVDMKSPGITVRPLRQVHGYAGFNEVFLDNVRTPADWMLGDTGEGWKVSRTTLRFERAFINSPDMMDDLVRKLKADAHRILRHGRPLMEDPVFREKLSIVEEYSLGHRYSVHRQNAMDAAGEDPGISTLCNKLTGTELVGMRIAELWQDVVGDEGALMPGPDTTYDDVDAVYWILRSIGSSIAGGTSNIQRSIIAQRGLGLPRD
ncbi:MAG: acyl-CoA dehydrogenase family protein [Parvibaculaceae bacterium]